MLPDRAPIAVCLHLLTVAAFAQPATVQIKDIRIPRLASRPQLEQFLNGRSRADMKRIDDFRQRAPGDGVPVSRKTAAWIGYDDTNLYAVFVCESPAAQTRARMARREDIFSDDVVGVILDTYHDRQHGYEFFVNPYGVQADAIEGEAQNDDFSFDTLWYSDGRLTPDGFAAMLTIPFRSLRFVRTPVQTWGMALMRIIPTNNENAFWPYITQKVNGFNQQLANLSGLEGISPGRNLQIIPYAAFAGSHFLDNPTLGAPSFRGKNDFRAGLDAKAVLHDSLTLDVAVNPDFSQVESDDPQVTVNQRFEVQFPEKGRFSSKTRHISRHRKTCSFRGALPTLSSAPASAARLAAGTLPLEPWAARHRRSRARTGARSVRPALRRARRYRRGACTARIRQPIEHRNAGDRPRIRRRL